MANFIWASRTDTGLLREHNEDSILVDEELGLGIVADGIGGHSCGEVASAIAVSKIRDCVANGHTLINALKLAHNEIQHQSQRPGQHGMGTTAVAIQVDKNNVATVAWAGDSRAYLYMINEDILLPITKDHSIVQALIDAGKITADEARVHPHRNKILQSLGSYHQIEPEDKHINFGKDCLVFLCSDGVTEHLPDYDLLKILKRGTRDLELLIDRIFEIVHDRGAIDNLSIVVCKNKS